MNKTHISKYFWPECADCYKNDFLTECTQELKYPEPYKCDDKDNILGQVLEAWAMTSLKYSLNLLVHIRYNYQTHVCWGTQVLWSYPLKSLEGEVQDLPKPYEPSRIVTGDAADAELIEKYNALVTKYNDLELRQAEEFIQKKTMFFYSDINERDSDDSEDDGTEDEDDTDEIEKYFNKQLESRLPNATCQMYDGCVSVML